MDIEKKCSSTLYPSRRRYGAVDDCTRRPHHRLVEESSSDRQSSRLPIARNVTVAVLCVFALLAGYYRANSREGDDGVNERSQLHVERTARFVEEHPTAAGGASPSGESGQALAFTALNFYHVRDGKPGQDYPWLKDLKLVEPHRETTLAVEAPREGFEYRWDVRPTCTADSCTSSSGGESSPIQAAGAVAEVVLTSLEENMITLEEVNVADGKIVRRLEETVMVKYVRREIRSLTDDEREELLDAMFTIWDVRVDGGNGKELYGDGYADIYAINRLHHKAATHGSCDHFHDGLGFLVSHSVLTNTFEYSLQAVNPKLTVPYWDFTIETSTSTETVYNPASPYTRTPLLDASWFGTADLDDGMVKDGRWAKSEIPKVRDNNPGGLEPDVYGKLRAPWNTNDRAYLTRGLGQLCQLNTDQLLAWPTCQTHYELTTGFHTFYDWVWDSMQAPHAPLHLWLGGTMDCAGTYEAIGELVGNSIAETLTLLVIYHRRNLFCEDVWYCDGRADVQTKPPELLSSGQCGCHGYDLTQGSDYKIVMESMEYLEDLIGDFDDTTQRKVVEALCTGVVNFGSHTQSSSTFDPLFWPIHPTMERLYQFPVLTGSIDDFFWTDADTNVTFADGTTVSEITSVYSDHCIGHHGSDVFPYYLLDTDTTGFEVKTGVRGQPVFGNMLTNREILTALDPRANSLSYVYDKFEWSHCAADGFDFNDAWDDTELSSRNTRPFSHQQKPHGRLGFSLYSDFNEKMAQRLKKGS
ncbi:unnamed protein product [Ectocarpus sp. 6 AP-2014]